MGPKIFFCDHLRRLLDLVHDRDGDELERIEGVADATKVGGADADEGLAHFAIELACEHDVEVLRDLHDGAAVFLVDLDDCGLRIADELADIHGLTLCNEVLSLWKYCSVECRMSSRSVAIEVCAGDDSTLTLTADPVVDISGFTIVLYVSREPGSDVLFSTGTGSHSGNTSYLTISDGPNGVVTATVVRADMLALGPGNFAFDLQRTDDNHRTTLLRGDFLVREPVGGL